MRHSGTRDFRFIQPRCIAAKGAIRQTASVNRRGDERRGYRLCDLRSSSSSRRFLRSRGGSRDDPSGAIPFSTRARPTAEFQFDEIRGSQTAAARGTRREILIVEQLVGGSVTDSGSDSSRAVRGIRELGTPAVL